MLLIAHRGGVVDDDRSENSHKALEEAIRRGYTHVEIDARITADDGLVCFHNDELMEEAGVPGKVSEMATEEVCRIVLTRSGETIPSFDEYCAWCTGRIGVMIDLKGCDDERVDAYTDALRRSLWSHGLLSEAMILVNRTPVRNQDVIARELESSCRTAWRGTVDEAVEATKADPGFQSRHYVFHHGLDMSADDVTAYKACGLQVIASINTHHYKEGDPLVLGRRHIEDLRDAGADGFQIDSVYDNLFFDE